MKLKNTYKDLQPGRKLFHVLFAWVFVCLYLFWLTPMQMQLVGGVVFLVVALLEVYRLNNQEKALENKIARTLLRRHEYIHFSSLFWTVFTFWFLSFVVGRDSFIFILLLLSIADPMANIVGLKYGKVIVLGRKTLMGSFAFFCSSLFVAILFMVLGSGLSVSVIVKAFFIASVATIVEAISIKVDDNVTVAIALALVLLFL